MTKIKITLQSGDVVTISAKHNWTGANTWTVSPKGKLSADSGDWLIQSNAWGPNNIVFYGIDKKTKKRKAILFFEAATKESWGDPFDDAKSGSGSYKEPNSSTDAFDFSDGSASSTLEWKVL